MAELKKITNEQLIEELKARGFWVMSDRQNPVQSFVVSVNPPKEEIFLVMIRIGINTRGSLLGCGI